MTNPNANIISKDMNEVYPFVPNAILLEEIATLDPSCLLISRGDFQVYLAAYSQIPNVIKQIGILREITFRAVGEGTGKSCDIDEFDTYYQNLFIWDNKNKQICGGYRMGFGKDVLSKHGIDALYINSLFKIDKSAHKLLEQSIELGRSFIIQEYQKAYLPFFLLWQGILHVLVNNPSYQYLIGPVSISKYYSNISKSLIVEFVKRHFYDVEIAKLFKPRMEFEPAIDQADIQNMMSSISGSNLKNLEAFLNTIVPEHIKVPILLKQYTKLNAKFISFNIDPNFSYALDGLMLLNIKDLPKDVIELLNDK